MTGLIGRKLGMTRVFDAEGTHVPVTVIEAGPCPVVQVGQSQVQLGFGTKKPTRTAKALAGHVKKAGLEITSAAAPKPTAIRGIGSPARSRRAPIRRASSRVSACPGTWGRATSPSWGSAS